jgi:hypothetical protein
MQNYFIFCAGVKLGLSHNRKNIDSVREQGDENIWIENRESNRRSSIIFTFPPNMIGVMRREGYVARMHRTDATFKLKT